MQSYQLQLDLILDYFRKANHPRRFNRVWESLF